MSSVKIGRIDYDPDSKIVRVDGQVKPMRRQLKEILAYLMSRSPDFVSREELSQAIWENPISGKSVSRDIGALRRALGEDRSLIKTSYGRGYSVVDLSSPPPEIKKTRNLHEIYGWTEKDHVAYLRRKQSRQWIEADILEIGDMKFNTVTGELSIGRYRKYTIRGKYRPELLHVLMRRAENVLPSEFMMLWPEESRKIGSVYYGIHKLGLIVGDRLVCSRSRGYRIVSLL